MRKAYDKLQKSESFFKEITDNASDVIFITDRNGDAKYCSRSVERFLGYKPEELIGRSAFTLIHPDDFERAFNDYSEALLSKDKAISNAFRVLHKDGSERYFEGLGRNLLDNPLVSGFIMNICDSTARKRMEEELKENESRYKQLFDNANVGIYRIDFKTGKFSDANNTFLEYTGYKQEELNSLSPYDILTEDSKKRFTERLEKRSRGEKVPETVEFDIVDRKGKQWCIHLNNRNIYDAQGHVIASEVVAQDITERKRMEDILRESERKYKLIAEKMNDIVWIADMDLKVIYVTPSVHKILGFTQEEIKNQTLEEKITHDSLSFGMEIWARELAVEEQGHDDPERTVSVVLEYYHKDGSTRWLDTVVSGIRDDQGVLTGIHGVCRDITKRKLAEEELKKSKMLLDSVFNSSQDLILVVDRDLKVLMSNWKSPLYAGHTEFPIGSHCYEAFINRDTPCESCVALGVFNTEKPVLTEYYNQYTKLFKEVSASPIFDDNNHVIMVAEHVRDITQRKLEANALRESERQYKLITEKMTDIVWIVDPDLRTIYVTPSIQTVLGFSQEERMRQTVDQQITPDSLSLGLEILARERTTEEQGNADPNRAVTLILEYYHKDGSTRWMETTMSGLRNDQGVAIGIHGVSRDITKRKLAEEQLRKSEANYRQRVETTHDLIICIDLDFKITYVNKAIANLVGKFDPIGKNLLDYTPPDKHELQNAIMQKRREGFSDMLSFEWEIFYPLENTLIFDIKSTLLTDDGKPSGIMFVARDITKRKLAEEKLRKSEELYTRLVNSIPDIIIRTDLEGNILFVNDQVLQSGGYRKDEIEGRNLLTFAAHEDQEKIVKDLQRVKGGGRLGPAEYNLLTKDGEIKPYDVNGDVLYNEEGKPSGFVCVCRDISERKKVEEALSRSEEKHRTIIENIEDGYAEVDLKGNFLFVNNALCIIDGYPKNELIKLNYRDIMDEENAKKIYAAYHKVFITGESEKDLEYEIITKNGIIKFLETSVSPIKDADKRVIAFRGIVRDRTERKLAEEKFYKIFMTTPDCIAITRLKDGLIKDVNQGFEDMVGWKREIAIGTKSTEPPLNFWVDLSERDFLAAELGMGRDILHRQIEFRRSDNSVRIGIYSARPINVDGEESLIFILQDITEQKRMEKELAESDKTKLMSQIASGVAHEVRNPLHAIQAISEAMAIDMDEKSDYRDYLMHIKTQVERLSHLMNDLLELGKPIQSSLFSQALLTEIATAALGYWMEAHPQLSQRVKIVNNLQHDALVLADSNKIQQVIINLMENAAQNSPKDEMILLRLGKASERYLMVEVIDKGVGLKSQDQFTVFEPFYTTRKGGTGLGLSLCKHIIENHGGTIEIFNNKDVPGCTARFTIPAYNKQGA
jgi:PAS domain S-box-containing protein